MPKQLEQIGKHQRPGKYKRFLKKLATKIRRRAEKANPADAPTKKRYLGWGT